MINDLTALLNTIINWLTSIVALYSTYTILSIFFAIWVVSKISKILKKIM